MRSVGVVRCCAAIATPVITSSTNEPPASCPKRRTKRRAPPGNLRLPHDDEKGDQPADPDAHRGNVQRIQRHAEPNGMGADRVTGLAIHEREGESEHRGRPDSTGRTLIDDADKDPEQHRRPGALRQHPPELVASASPARLLSNWLPVERLATCASSAHGSAMRRMPIPTCTNRVSVRLFSRRSGARTSRRKASVPNPSANPIKWSQRAGHLERDAEALPR